MENGRLEFIAQEWSKMLLEVSLQTREKAMHMVGELLRLRTTEGTVDSMTFRVGATILSLEAGPEAANMAMAMLSMYHALR
jgi:hypothetical protein